MASIVSVFALAHAPGVTGWLDKAPPDEQKRILAGYAAMAEHFKAARADVIVGVANDHLLNFPMDSMPDFCVGIGDQWSGPAPWFRSWVNLPEYSVGGHRALGRAIDDGTGWLLGVVNVFVPIIAVVVGYLLMRGEREGDGTETVGTVVGAVLAFVVVEGVAHLAGGEPDLHAGAAALGDAGGVVGWMIGAPLKSIASIYGAVIILGAVGLVGALLFTGMPMATFLEHVAHVFGPLGRMLRGVVLSIGRSRKFVPLMATAKPEITRSLLELVASGRLTPLVAATLPLAQAPQALALVDRRPAITAVLPVVTLVADLRTECIEATIQISTLAHRQAVGRTIARFQACQIVELSTQSNSFLARQRAVAHANIDALIEVRLSLVDALPALGGSGRRHRERACRNGHSEKRFHRSLPHRFRPLDGPCRFKTATAASFQRNTETAAPSVPESVAKLCQTLHTATQLDTLSRADRHYRSCALNLG